MDREAFETSALFHELLDELRALEPKFYEGPNAPQDEQSVLEGYKWIFSILQVAFDVYVWADTARPRFVDIVGPYKKWGGDNADAYYQFAPIDPQRTYRIKGKAGDAVYWSLTVYGGPADGRYSAHIVGTVNDRMVDVAPDGTFEIVLSANPPEGVASLRARGGLGRARSPATTSSTRCTAAEWSGTSRPTTRRPRTASPMPISPAACAP